MKKILNIFFFNSNDSSESISINRNIHREGDDIYYEVENDENINKVRESIDI